ncbi:GerAB/ArcD/ProY family transporter [Paenibacillus thiaminolyticus]|uniref:GerAB/ArcD/ProY family transporter n=1 Tax=Paenibacillus thiaminolyticus TaxID=49283 RepID=A0A3A3GIH6_PANTH|nr:GerAB/ArcD/ProY family transporter [Paenibacillus thiaminolyticus]RJG21789.1 hypothetical protein DQX05_20490 [Paenibacillus thiaminolyticus]
MSRYQFYLFMLCAFISPALYLPRWLHQARYDGALASVGIAMLLGLLMAWLFKTSLKPFHKLSLTEVMERHVPRHIGLILYSVLGFTWFAAGASTLITICYVIKGFINPNMDFLVLLSCFLVAVYWASLRASIALLYNLELWVFIITPIIVFIWIKGIRNDTFSWDAVLTLNDYVLNAPSWDGIAVASFLFTGYISLSVFQATHQGSGIRWLWLIPLIGTAVFSAVFFIPIGLHGTQAVDQYIHIWVNTADSIQLKYGMIERGVFLLLFSYIIMSLVFAATSWHVAAEWISGVFKERPAHIKRFMIGIAGIAVLVIGYYVNEKQLMTLTHRWFSLRFAAELLLVAVMVIVRRRGRSA